ncbi:MAG: hypothetical protein JXA93_02810 [Anaerolineae bacterium]|nr:hypothetical protein [Anaerolineae bacterium]
MSRDYSPADTSSWKQARRAAFIQDVMSTFTQRADSLLSFEEISGSLHLDHVQYREVQEVPLDHIVGSVGRYADFTRTFLPRQDHLQERWQKIEEMMSSGHSLPPIDLYQVGEVYFVRDGNHRVSVARQRRFATIRAHVWQCDTPIPLQPDSDVDEMLCQLAHAAFLERTHFDRLCPEVTIRLTQPGGYEDLVREIEAFQQALSEIDRCEIPFDEAVTLWSELRYVPIVEIIREREALAEFPDRTEADLYLWLSRNRQELAARYEHTVLMHEAADDLARQAEDRTKPIRKLWKNVARATTRWREGKKRQ